MVISLPSSGWVRPCQPRGLRSRCCSWRFMFCCGSWSAVWEGWGRTSVQRSGCGRIGCGLGCLSVGQWSVELPPIELERDPMPPPLRDTVALQATVEDAIGCLAQDFLLQSIACVREFGSFHVAVSGGGSLVLLERLCRELMVDPAYRSLPWRETHVWTVDDSAVAHDHPESVYGVLRDFVIGHSGIPRAQVHGMSAFRPAADVEYERALVGSLSCRPSGHDRLDMAVLALGAGGIAGRLDPMHVGGTDRLVVRLPGGSVTMTPRMLSGSRFLGVVAVGGEVRGALERVSRGEIDPVPTLMGGHTRWYVDHEASPQGCAASVKSHR